MIAKLKAMFDVFRKGQRVANAATWQNRSVAAGALTAFLLAAASAARAMGYELPFDDSDIEKAGYALVTIITSAMTVIGIVTSRGVGLPEKKQ